MSRWRSPVALFLAIGLLALVAIVLATTRLGERAAAEGAVDEARRTTRLLARSVAEPALPRGLADGEAGAVDRFDRAVFDRLHVPDADRIKIWNQQGWIVYSDEPRLIGEQFELGEEELEVLQEGGTDAEVSEIDEPENRFEDGLGEQLEVYTRIVDPDGEPLLFEMYYAGDTIDRRQTAILGLFRPITLGALALVVLVATVLLAGLTRQLRRSAEDRERLLQAAVDASDAERLRIARDLHDGVVQDLAGATFTVSAVAGDQSLASSARGALTEAAGSMRTGLRGLRSLLVEIYPPELDATGLEAALDDLLAPAAERGIDATAEVSGVEAVPRETVRLVWRVAQEAVRNTLRHSGASTLRVSVVGNGESVELTVTDDGTGFDADRRAEGGRFGLRGMLSLIQDAGGRLDVRSTPGEGTTIKLQMRGGGGR